MPRKLNRQWIASLGVLGSQSEAPSLQHPARHSGRGAWIV